MHPRPVGPRNRPISPAPFALPLPQTAPLNIRRTRIQSSSPPPSSSSLSVPENSPPPFASSPSNPASLSLQIPGDESRPVTPTPKGLTKLAIPIPKVPPKLSLSINNNTSHNTQNNQEDPHSIPGPFSGGYYGGASLEPAALSADGPDEVTMRPANANAQPNTMEGLRATIQRIDINQPPVQIQSHEINTAMNNPDDQWSDEFLQELERLGEGAGGAVHKVRDTRTDKIMARKTITTLEAPIRQLLRELQIMSSTSHPNIIHFYAAYISPSSSEVKLLMEFGEGGSLDAIGKRIREKGWRVGEKVAGRLAEGILQGLAYLHTLRIIHRDIKPSNVLLSREGVVKVCDFGVSGELIGSEAGTFTGTSYYMAPERMSGLHYSIRADVWSTGLSLLELVQNRFPFPSDLSHIELMIHITTSEPPRLEDEEDPPLKWSSAMKDFIKETLTHDPNTRPRPEDMLEHRWITMIMKMEVNMAKWIREVWGWPKPSKRTNVDTSRPGSSRREPSISSPGFASPLVSSS